MRYRYIKVQSRQVNSMGRPFTITAYQVWDRNSKMVEEHQKEDAAKRQVLELNGDLEKVQVDQETLF